jgi:hypothetical protein
VRSFVEVARFKQLTIVRPSAERPERFSVGYNKSMDHRHAAACTREGG